MHWTTGILLLAISATAGWAQESETSEYTFGGDTFLAGQTIAHQADGTDDLFMAGERVSSDREISGTAHLVGRWIDVRADVGQDIYAAGQEVTIDGTVKGDATLAGQKVTLQGAVGGDLRASGSRVEIAGPVAGYAMIAGEDIYLDAPVSGDMSVSARSLDFGSGAKIAGSLTVYESSIGMTEVPASVVPEDRIFRRETKEWEDEIGDIRPFSFWKMVKSFLTGVVIVAGLAALIAAIAPQTMAAMRRRVLQSPGRAVLFGFLTLSALSGATIILAMTLIGMLLSPATIFFALLTGFLGYVIGAYALGVGLLSALGRGEPATTTDRALAAAAGAVVAGLIAMIPVVGWLCMLLLVMAGAGAIVIRLFRPAFFVGE